MTCIFYATEQGRPTVHAPDWPYAASSRATFAWSSSFGAQAFFVATGQRVMPTSGGFLPRLQSTLTMLSLSSGKETKSFDFQLKETSLITTSFHYLADWR